MKRDRDRELAAARVLLNQLSAHEEWVVQRYSKWTPSGSTRLWFGIVAFAVTYGFILNWIGQTIAGERNLTLPYLVLLASPSMSLVVPRLLNFAKQYGGARARSE